MALAIISFISGLTGSYLFNISSFNVCISILYQHLGITIVFDLIELIKRVGINILNARLTEHFISFASSLINSMIQWHKCKIIFIIWH